MRHFLVVNPGSANGQTGRRWPELHARIAQRIGEYAHQFTEAPLDAVRITRKALEDGYDCICSVGGDGTLNEVVNGFFRDGAPINPNAAVALLPRGTGGDFRRTFGWDADFDAALARLQTPDVRPLDVGVVEFTDNSGRSTTRYFVNVCSFGVSGVIANEVNTHSKVLGGKASFFLGSVRGLLKYKDRRVRVRFDNGPAEEVPVTALAVANCAYFGGGMKVAPEADPSDGIFDVTVWSGFNILDFVTKASGLYDGSHVKFDGTRTLKCREVTAECVDGNDVLLDLDGEQPGRIPCSVRMMPQAIRLMI